MGRFRDCPLTCKTKKNIEQCWSIDFARRKKIKTSYTINLEKRIFAKNAFLASPYGVTPWVFDFDSFFEPFSSDFGLDAFDLLWAFAFPLAFGFAVALALAPGAMPSEAFEALSLPSDSLAN